MKRSAALRPWRGTGATRIEMRTVHLFQKPLPSFKKPAERAALPSARRTALSKGFWKRCTVRKRACTVLNGANNGV